MLANNYYYFGIVEDTDKIIKNCPICNIKKNFNKKKRIESKIIIFNKPK